MPRADDREPHHGPQSGTLTDDALRDRAPVGADENLGK